MDGVQVDNETKTNVRNELHSTEWSTTMMSLSSLVNVFSIVSLSDLHALFSKTSRHLAGNKFKYATSWNSLNELPISVAKLTETKLSAAWGTSNKQNYFGFATLSIVSVVTQTSQVLSGSNSITILDYVSFSVYYSTYRSPVINTVLFCSTWLLCIVSVERYLAVCHPIRARYGMTNVITSNLLTWPRLVELNTT